jgi:hypothetical protein
LIAHAWWFSRGTLASSTTKTGRHHIAEILLKVVLKHIKSKINQTFKTKYATKLTALYNVIICRALREAIVHILIACLYFGHYYIVIM